MSLAGQVTLLAQAIAAQLKATQPGPWQNVTYATNVGTNSTTYNAIQVRNNGNGTCTYRGRGVANAALAAGALLWTVPVDCRPATKSAYCGLINSAQGVVTKPDGTTTTAASVTSGTPIQAEGVTYSL